MARVKSSTPFLKIVPVTPVPRRLDLRRLKRRVIAPVAVLTQRRITQCSALLFMPLGCTSLEPIVSHGGSPLNQFHEPPSQKLVSLHGPAERGNGWKSVA